MAITGIGIDVCSIERVEKLITSEIGQHWLERIFTPIEQEEIKNRFQIDSSTKKSRLAIHLAGLYAAKEAIGKATHQGLMGPGKLSWQDIEITHSSEGAPVAHILDGVWALKKIEISISHDGGIATAIAILE